LVNILMLMKLFCFLHPPFSPSESEYCKYNA
jgi:hypothetical protein